MNFNFMKKLKNFRMVPNADKMKAGTFRKFINLWPPFLGAGIKVRKIAEDYSSADVEMKLHAWNKNYVGTHFGGSIFSMTDPFFALILIKGLGKDYIVWDKASEIKFKKPGKGVISAHFNITAEKIQEIRDLAEKNDKVEPKFVVEVKDQSGDVVAEVTKTLYVRHKNKPQKPRP
jgi:acyl-coenzyme A thioesterase PaaI-like protein